MNVDNFQLGVSVISESSGTMQFNLEFVCACRMSANLSLT
jgi:hypothetical protein